MEMAHNKAPTAGNLTHLRITRNKHSSGRHPALEQVWEDATTPHAHASSLASGGTPVGTNHVDGCTQR